MPEPDLDLAALQDFAVQAITSALRDCQSDRPYRRGPALALVTSGKLTELLDALDVSQETQQRIIARALQRYQSAVKKTYASQPATDRG